MAVKYKLYQENRKNSKYQGKWYGRAVHEDTVGIDELADIMQANCTVKRADILAVISELVETMKTQLQNSMRVKLDRFGSFKIGLNTSPADSAKDFTPQKNVKRLHIIFQPEVKVDNNGTRTRSFLTGTKLRELNAYNVDKSDDGTDAGNTGTGGNSGNTDPVMP